MAAVCSDLHSIHGCLQASLHLLFPLLPFSTYTSGKLCTLLFLHSALWWNNSGSLFIMSFCSLSQSYLAFKAQLKRLLP